MEYDEAEQRALHNDNKDLFAAVVALGSEVEEYDAESGVFLRVFKRGEEWREALTAIRRYGGCGASCLWQAAMESYCVVERSPCVFARIALQNFKEVPHSRGPARATVAGGMESGAELLAPHAQPLPH